MKRNDKKMQIKPKQIQEFKKLIKTTKKIKQNHYVVNKVKMLSNMREKRNYDVIKQQQEKNVFKLNGRKSIEHLQNH